MLPSFQLSHIFQWFLQFVAVFSFQCFDLFCFPFRFTLYCYSLVLRFALCVCIQQIFKFVILPFIIIICHLPIVQCLSHIVHRIYNALLISINYYHSLMITLASEYAITERNHNVDNDQISLPPSPCRLCFHFRFFYLCLSRARKRA